MTNFHTLKLNASSIGTAAAQNAATAARPAQTETAAPAPQPAAERTTRAAVGGKRLVGLAALGAVSTSTAVATTGAVHSGVIRDLIAGIAVSSAAATLAALAIAVKGPQAAATSTAAAPPARKRFSTSKAVLVLMMLIGIVAYFGGAGTFAGFTAETSNPNDSLASGTLVLRNNVSTNCDSSAGASSNNVNANCNVALAFTNQEPGVYAGTATVTLTNTGSLNASKLYLWAPFGNAVYSGSTIGVGGTVSSLPVATSGQGPVGVEGTIAGGDLVTVSYGPNQQTFKVGAAGAAPGASSIPIVNDVTYPNTSTMSIQTGATIQDTSSDTTAANTNCYDQQQTVYSFNPSTNNPMCSAALLYVQETTGGKNYCWYGNVTGAPTGACTAPISTKPSAGLSGGTVVNGAYTVTAITGNIKSGDTIAFNENGNTVNCSASASYYIGTTSITVGGCAAAAGSVNSGFDNNVVITDTTTTGTLANDTTDTISQFDIRKNYNSKLELTPVSANGTTGATGTDLASSGSRTFVIGVFIPGPTSSQNYLQGLKSTFGLTWHIDQ